MDIVELILSNVDIETVKSNPELLILPLLLLVGWYVKKFTKVSNKYIPPILGSLGVALAEGFYFETHGLFISAIIGLAYTITAVGVHFGIKKTIGKRNDDNSPSA